MIILGTNSIKDTGYDVANSCRFDDGSSTQMNKTISSTSTTWTFSCWIKLNPTGTNQYLASWDMGSGESLGIGIEASSNQLFIYTSSTGQAPKLYDGKLRDPSAWMNIVIKNSSGTITSYINGTQAKTSITGTALASGTLRIGCWTGSNFFYDGYMSEVVLIDGTAYNADSFGEFNSQTGIWVPKDVSGLTFGSDGFYLDFKDSANLGNDANGGTDLTEVNLTSIDQSTDTCSTNFATMNPLDLGATTGGEFLQGNLDVHMGGTAQGVYYSTIGVSSGKWYVEVNPDSGSGGNSYIGISGNANNSRGANDGLGDLAFDYGYYQSDGSLRNNDSDSSYGSSYSNGNIIGVYLDLDNNKLYFSVNGTVQNSGTGISISAVTNTPTGNYFFCVGDDNAFAERRFNLNFGSPIESISSSNTDDNGFGNFEYSPNITGDGSAKKFYSLNTKNLTTVLA